MVPIPPQDYRGAVGVGACTVGRGSGLASGLRGGARPRSRRAQSPRATRRGAEHVGRALGSSHSARAGHAEFQ
eukprot:COSAG02_NODE_8306_length_2623_cov_6.816165_3_plen_73_part_00